jgi:DNA-binding MarR family transcriptional regulator
VADRTRGQVKTLEAASFYQDDTVGEIRLAAVFRRGFRQALVLIDRALAQHDLSPLQYHLLLEVGSAGEEGCVQGDLADLLHTPEARISLLVHELGERGLVDTRRTAPDRRVVRVGLTAAGCRLVEAALHSQRDALRDLAKDFEVPGVAEMLRRAVQLYLGVDIAPDSLR